MYKVNLEKSNPKVTRVQLITDDRSYTVKPRFVVITIIVILLMISAWLIGTMDRYSAQAFGASEVIEYTLGFGDTAWDLANTYKPSGMDPRKYLSIMKDYNEGVSLGYLKAGQTVNIPILDTGR